ncbi:MAG: response regulator transcription factor [Chloroflexi bacterium]|nr:response regulator transcription factor [Chloroflexota bacterium]
MTTNGAKMRVLIVEDQPLFRDLLRTALSAYPTVEVIAAVDNPRDAVRIGISHKPDAILMDVELGEEMTGIEAARKIKEARPQTGVVILSSHKDKEYLRSVAEGRGGGWSYLLKQTMGDTDAIVRAMEGSTWGLVTLDPAIIEYLRPDADSNLQRLTEKQMTVVKNVAGGAKTQEIARRTNLTEAEVDSEIDRICSELGVSGKTGAERRNSVAVAYLNGTHRVVERDPAAEAADVIRIEGAPAVAPPALEPAGTPAGAWGYG